MLALPFCNTVQKAKRYIKGYPREPKTLGERIRKRRMDLGLKQKELAQELQVDEMSIVNWEKNRTTPATCFIPRIIQFLGYSPFSAASSLHQKLRVARVERGLSQKQLAELLGVDSTSIRDWESGVVKPFRRSLQKIQLFLDGPHS
jgi:transcriptional regulator with XRE-family HTH domain